MSEEFSGEFLELVKQKGVYPYEYMDSFKKFSENKLPDRSKFFSSLKDECISESDIDMHLFIEKGMRGGISYIAKRHSKANSKYMKSYDSIKESKFIKYLDANNLYSWAMSQYLPYCGFKWLNQKEISDFCLNSIREGSSIGYILEVDLEYPSELHDLRNDYPLAPEKLEISQNMLSKYCLNIANEYGIKIDGVNKLVPNLDSKNKCVAHYKNLQLYLSLRMKLTKIHRILKFKQSDCIDLH